MRDGSILSTENPRGLVPIDTTHLLYLQGFYECAWKDSNLRLAV